MVFLQIDNLLFLFLGDNTDGEKYKLIFFPFQTKKFEKKIKTKQCIYFKIKQLKLKPKM